MDLLCSLLLRNISFTVLDRMNNNLLKLHIQAPEKKVERIDRCRRSGQFL
jgi:hypothetical protein